MQTIEHYNIRCIHKNAKIKQTPENTGSNQETDTHTQIRPNYKTSQPTLNVGYNENIRTSINTTVK